MDMRYDVTVRNELTGEMTTVEVRSDCWQQAQVDALVLLFRSSGWRKAVAYRPVLAALPAAS